MDPLGSIQITRNHPDVLSCLLVLSEDVRIKGLLAEFSPYRFALHSFTSNQVSMAAGPSRRLTIELNSIFTPSSGVQAVPLLWLHRSPRWLMLPSPLIVRLTVPGP